MKQLITGGCSFSECIGHPGTWPRHLADALPGYQHTSTAIGSQGNGLISRRVIYQVTETLKHTAAQDILVGIMWSGPDRHDFYINSVPEMFESDGWMENPTKFIKDSPGAWAIMNNGWKMHHAKIYFTEFPKRDGWAIDGIIPFTRFGLRRIVWCVFLDLPYRAVICGYHSGPLWDTLGD